MQASCPRVSVIIPARNEAALIRTTLDAVLAAVRHLDAGSPADRLHLAATCVEVIVVDNQSIDQTCALVQGYHDRYGVRLEQCPTLGAAQARNLGASCARGSILVFVDADTVMPPETLVRIVDLCERQGYHAGITRLASLEGGWRAWLWWTFWEHVRRLPLPRAKAMPALMFCTRAAFATYGPFDEQVSIGEEWPILAGIYRVNPAHLVYDRTLTARSSNRRMDLQPWGYVRTFGRYVWAVLHRGGRVNYTDRLRHPVSEYQLDDLERIDP